MNMSFLGGDWLAIIVFGFLAGFIARAIIPGKARNGLISTTLLGIAGAVAAAWLTGQFDVSLGSRWLKFAAAIAGSMLLLWIVGSLRKK